MLSTKPPSCRLIVSLVAAATLVTASSPRAQQPAKAEQEVRDAVKQIVAAYAANDIEKYFSFYAPDMTVLRATGRWTTQGYHDRWQQVVEGGGGVATADVVDLQIQVSPSGDSAVASYQMPVKPRYPNAEAAKGQAAQIIYYMTDVYFRRNGQWKIVHLHWTVQPPPRA